LGDAVQSVLTGKADAKTALDNAQKQADELLAQFPN